MPVLKVKHNGEWINVGSSGSGGGSNINIDPTLTQSGSAADAKASGDAIRNLNTLVGNKSVAEQIQEAIGSGGNTGGSGITVQSDWNQNDETAPNYVKNRTHYDAGHPVEFTIFNGESLTFTEHPNMDETGVMYAYEMQESDAFNLVAGDTYYVTIDGETYEVKAVSMAGENVYIGNLSIMISTYPNTGEPFFIMPNNGHFVLNIAGETHNITINEIKSVVEKEIIPDNEYTFSVMDPGMIPILINIGSFDLSNISEGDSYNITFDGVEYQNTVKTMSGAYVFGNLNLMSSSEEDTGEPYLALYADGMSGMYALTTSIQPKFSIDKVLADGTYENIVPEGTRELVGVAGGYLLMDAESDYVLEENATYKIIWNDIEYTCTSVGRNEVSGEESISTVYIGNLNKIGMSETDTGEPFIFGYALNQGFVVMFIPDASFTDTHQIKVIGYVSGVKKLDKKYLPDDINIPVASWNKIGGVKVYNTTSDNLSSASGYSKIWLSTNDNTIYAKAPTMSNLTFTGNTNTTYNGSSPITVNIPTALKNPNRLTFTGGSTATYDGSSAVSVAIPTSLKNPNALTFNGYTSATYDGSSAKTITLPTSLKNPYALTFTGGATDTYDGSSAKTINIPTSLKNPNALTFTGLIEGSYDGSEAVNIEIPTGLPEVTNDNNDQILQVVDGTWKANNPVFNYTAYIDQGNGYKYYVYMYNGELVIQVECTGIEVTTMPTTMEYYYGEAFNPAGMVVNAISADGSTKIITDYTYSAPEFITENTAITISWVQYDQTYSTTFEVSVIECTGIEVTTLPTKTEYFSGQAFDPTGMTVIATYADGYTKVITNYTCSANLTVDNPTVTISYANSISTFEVTVHDSNAEFIDFTYTINEDNSIILDTWKGTLNGVNSTECVIPNGNGIAKIVI